MGIKSSAAETQQNIVLVRWRQQGGVPSGERTGGEPELVALPEQRRPGGQCQTWRQGQHGTGMSTCYRS